jgi:hypothetical protein
MATAPLAWLRSITSVSTVGYTRHWALWTVAATERGLVILESGGRHAAAGRGDLDLTPQHSVGATADKLRSNAERYQMRAKPVTRCGSVERCV